MTEFAKIRNKDKIVDLNIKGNPVMSDPRICSLKNMRRVFFKNLSFFNVDTVNPYQKESKIMANTDMFRNY